MKSAGLNVDPAQVQRFSGAGPRYTSYPTVPAWSTEVGEDEARSALERAAAEASEALSVYVHLPFCVRRCLFCACTVEITRNEERVERYLDALKREIELVAAQLGQRRRVTQLHWGGGTPTHLSCEQIRGLHAALSSAFEIAPAAEVSIEVHPHVTTAEQTDTLFDLGFNRLSMGVQDTDAHVQTVVQRDQTVEDTLRIVEQARQRDVHGVNLDLMYGLPAQTEETFRRTLETVAGIGPDRLAVYGYAHLPWRIKAHRALDNAPLPDPVLRARLFATAVEQLTGSGYEVIGLDHFALREDALFTSLVDGSLHRNFMGYTTERAPDMLAFGMSAIGDVAGTFLQNAPATVDYEAAIGEGRLATVRGLVRSPEDELRRAVIQSLMCRMHLDLDELEQELDLSDLDSRFADEWQRLLPLQDEGLCTIEPRRVEVTALGRLFLRHLAMVFDAYLQPDQESSTRFSQTL